MGTQLRRIRPGDGERLRDLRLRALADSPSAFASTLPTESTRPAAIWEEAATTRASGSEAATFVAEVDDAWVGLVGAFRVPGQPRVVELVAMWVAPQHRRSGTGSRLVEAVLAWARAGGAQQVELWVTRGNDAAMRLYLQAGFALTDDYQPLPSDPRRQEQRMVLGLSGGSGA